MLRILHLFYEILLGSEQLQNMILLYLDIILYTRKILLSTILLLFTRCATSNASRHFKSPLAMGRDAFKPKHASSVSISEVIDTGVNSNTILAFILTFLSQGVIILAEIVFGILQNYTLTESQQFHIEQLPRRKWRKASLYLFKT